MSDMENNECPWMTSTPGRFTGSRTEEWREVIDILRYARPFFDVNVVYDSLCVTPVRPTQYATILPELKLPVQ